MNAKTHTVDDLRTRLFDAIDAVKTGALSIDQARQISDLAQVVVNSAKVEVDHLRLVDGARSKFLPAPEHTAEPPEPDQTQQTTPKPAWPAGIKGVTQHRIRG